MPGKKRKGKAGAAEPVADNVGSAGREGLTQLEVTVSTQVSVRVIVVLAADVRGMEGVARDGWIEGVTENLEEVGIQTVVDFIRGVLQVNRRLGDRGHQRLHERTVGLLMEKACEIMFGPEEGE
jgi:hypothetical protein